MNWNIQYNNVQCLPFFFWSTSWRCCFNMARWLNYMTMTSFIRASHTSHSPHLAIEPQVGGWEFPSKICEARRIPNGEADKPNDDIVMWKKYIYIYMTSHDMFLRIYSIYIYIYINTYIYTYMCVSICKSTASIYVWHKKTQESIPHGRSSVDPSSMYSTK